MSDARKRALRFVVGFGLVSLFADVTYEGGRSIVGPYLAILGATPLLVGAIAGGGEFLGYALRVAAGRWVDRKGAHWVLIFIGYVINLFALPALALTAGLAPAASLIFAERLGKGLRAPARDAVLARASHELGRGYAFGLHETLDQIGALAGPLLVAGAVAWSGYRRGFAILALPAAVAMFFLFRVHRLEPEDTEPRPERSDGKNGFSRLYWLYLAFAGVMIAGFAHFQLLAYHLEVTHRAVGAVIPLLFALAMATDAVAAYVVGKLYDRRGMGLLIALPLLALPTAPLAFLGTSLWTIGAGVALWGAALGLQESVMRAAVADLATPERRGTAYGVFDAVFGASWMVGSLLMGWLYGISPRDLVIFAVVLEVVSIVPFLRLHRAWKTA